MGATATLKPVRDLGDYIREQRHSSQISLRQLARLAGVSNPYLSQIERGLRRPSAEILQQIAKALRISAEALYVQAGILDERGDGGEVPAAVLADARITERQKQVLLEIYESFCRENDVAAALPDPMPLPVAHPDPPQAGGSEAGARPTEAADPTGTAGPPEAADPTETAGPAAPGEPRTARAARPRSSRRSAS